MRKWINLLERYSEDNTFLLRHLGNQEFDYYNHWWEITLWAKETGNMEAFEEILGRDLSQDDLRDEEPDLFEKLPNHLQEEAAEWVIDWLSKHNPAELPANQFFSPEKKLIPRQTWLVHFTDHVDAIRHNGFQYGMADLDRLGLTTYFTHDSKKHGGYNFAFEATSRYAENAARKRSYGRDAVMFQNSGVKAYHSGDEEDQIIFWGSDVDVGGIVELRYRDGDWAVVGNGRDLFTGDFHDTVRWVIRNHQQYRNVLKK